jgi:hypothetical protein
VGESVGRTNEVALTTHTGDMHAILGLSFRRNVTTQHASPQLHDEVDRVDDALVRGKVTQREDVGGKPLQYMDRRTLGRKQIQYVERKQLRGKLPHNVVQLHKEDTTLVTRRKQSSNVQPIKRTV